MRGPSGLGRGNSKLSKSLGKLGSVACNANDNSATVTKKRRGRGPRAASQTGSSNGDLTVGAFEVHVGAGPALQHVGDSLFVGGAIFLEL